MPDTELTKRLLERSKTHGRHVVHPDGREEDCFDYDGALMREAAAALSAARAELVQFMAARGYATGHGDTVADMLAVLEGQAKGIARAEAIEEAAREVENVAHIWLLPGDKFVAATRALAAAGQGEK